LFGISLRERIHIRLFYLFQIQNRMAFIGATGAFFADDIHHNENNPNFRLTIPVAMTIFSV